ncbi:MAG TPA: BamA/TamA family outer membrane protein [Firmicutes bacterium]|nr:BamA/TamA family outer membrane protein [Bacillota bacterium]
MTRILKIPVLLGVVFFMFMMWSGPALAVGELVLSVEISGNKQVKEEQILQAVTNIRLGEALDRQAVVKDQQAIMDLGYFAMVEPYAEEFLGGIKVVFRVVENPQITRYEIKGLERITPEEVLPFFRQKPGDVFNYVTMLNDLVMAQQYFNEERGLLIPPFSGSAGEISELMQIDEEGVVHLHLTEARLGRIRYQGLERTKEFVVAREMTLKEGDILDLNVLREDTQQLARLQLFSDISPRLQPTTEPGVMDLIMEFKEGENRIFNMGISYTPVDNTLLGSFGITDPNLMGLGQKLSFNMEFNPNNVFNFNFEFQEPWLDAKQTSLGLKLYSNHTLSLSSRNLDGGVFSGKDGRFDNKYTYNYNEKKTGLNLTLGRPLNRHLRLSTSFRMERVTIDPQEWVADRNNQYEYEDAGGNKQTIEKEEDYPTLPLKQEYWDNSLGLGLNYNRLVYTGAYTTDGYHASLGLNLHGGIFGGEYDYQRLYGEFKQFYSPLAHTTLGYRVMGSKILGQTPDSSKLYLGGELSLRGYDVRHVSGDQQVLANFELRQRIPNAENLEAVLFYDVGTVDFEKYYHSYGVGFRYNIPLLGQLRFDFGWTPESGKPKFNFFFGEMF